MDKLAADIQPLHALPEYDGTVIMFRSRIWPAPLLEI
jgi:hypothetical protein